MSDNPPALRRSYAPAPDTPPAPSTSTLLDRERRRFLQLMAASVALSGAGCSGPPPETIVSYVKTPEELVSGTPVFYATAFVNRGYAHGVLVETDMGRPVKVEGNPLHPASLGATDAHAQASVLQLWDPDRSQTVIERGRITTWEAFETALRARLAKLRPVHGAGLALLTTTITSPTLAAQLARLLQRYPEARWYAYDPLHEDRAFAGAKLAFGRAVQPVYRFEAAQVVVALSARFLSESSGSVRYARDYVAARRHSLDQQPLRFYALETTPSLEGAMADERLALPPAELERSIWRLAARLGVGNAAFENDPRTARWEAAVAASLNAHRGQALVIAGDTLSAETIALVHALNAHLGNVGNTIHYIERVTAGPDDHLASLHDLTRALLGGEVDTLIVLGGNPAYDAPAALAFGEALQHAAFSAHLDLYRTETSRLATWHLPASHTYEQWSDARAYDGTASIVQPVIAPLYGGRSAHELVALIAQDEPRNGLAQVRSTWTDAASDFGSFWRESLRRGVVEGTRSTPVNTGSARAITPPKLDAQPLTVVWQADPSAQAGMFTNNAWLQELPRPLSKLTWDNAAYLSPAAAAAMQLRAGDVVVLTAENRALAVPVWILPGHADATITLPLGYGRWAAGRIGNGVGFNAYALMTVAGAVATPVTLRALGRRHAFATTQSHGTMEGRDIVRSAEWEQYLRDPRFATDAPRQRVPEESLYPPYSYRGYAWGMAIDLNACIGCNACTIACQAENNIPVVGKEEVIRGREMHWIRVDRYYSGAEAAPRTYFQPVPCMHCENAPCEEVCPVGATVHDSEGLNVQVYNRCIGTRFCSNNCPYKVRRFNFLQYSATHIESLIALQNPEVTVRQHGVMEKCNYCLQRVTRGRTEAEKERRRLRDGEVVTACQAVCPTEAIIFGDLNDPESRVTQAKNSPLNYALLAELNTRPRTTYLARVFDPDPELA
jgi:Fe-S-cluster-containing dehydrogenase component